MEWEEIDDQIKQLQDDFLLTTSKSRQIIIEKTGFRHRYESQPYLSSRDSILAAKDLMSIVSDIKQFDTYDNTYLTEVTYESQLNTTDLIIQHVTCRQAAQVISQKLQTDKFKPRTVPQTVKINILDQYLKKNNRQPEFTSGLICQERIVRFQTFQGFETVQPRRIANKEQIYPVYAYREGVERKRWRPTKQLIK
ncbi:hypothetical protein SS50377_27988 [Spironucleus salmonicida]|uniref:Uncharacterized protein n=1 Tax=Spironucleus salmonicida TaxID=348837 RepID=V6LDF7_9EUKA|nr:hypothetical protein SS50377_27988 [Spironucleus salmonicida]|eukprot:EST42545.1 Hypothetical protein SS50377_17859 [Spironucleus salmonicida]